MELHLYWVSALTYAFVLSIVLFDDIKATKKPSDLEKSYRLMGAWVLFFCLQDTLWGLCATHVIKSDSIFFLSSSVFHVSTVVTTFFWLKYVLDFLGDKVKNKKLFLTLDGIVICWEVVLVIVNCFKTTLFTIVDGEYVIGFLRPFTFINQHVVYLVIGITMLICTTIKSNKHVAHYRTVLLFTLTPILLGAFQFLFPDAPFYSLGYFLGCFIIHVFVVSNDREVYLSKEDKLKKIIELNRELEEKQTEIDEQFEILHAISGIFEYINLLDFDTQTAARFDVKNPEIGKFDLINDPYTDLNKKLAPTIDENDYERFLKFTDLSTLEDRMRDKHNLSAEFKFENGVSIQAIYIRVGDDLKAPFGRVAYVLRNVSADRKREQQVYSAMTNLVYSLHIFNLENDSFESLIESDILKNIVGNEESAQRMLNTIMRATIKDEYLDIMLEFVDLSTVSERMKSKKSLSCEFVGKFHGWTRMNFIPIEMNGDKVKKMVVTTQIIDSEKTEIINLVYKSSTDELTGLYNRRMYEEALDALSEVDKLDKCIIVALDVNGLKKVNDTLGHKAGDELIIGAASCMNKCFSSVGKVYRTGGDEFMAILRCDIEDLNGILTEFDQTIENWSGRLIESLSISYGYVATEDYPNLSVRDVASEADKRMYVAKSAYYRQNGIERREN